MLRQAVQTVQCQSVCMSGQYRTVVPCLELRELQQSGSGSNVAQRLHWYQSQIL